MAPSRPSRKPSATSGASSKHRRTVSSTRTSVSINVYDLIAPSRLSTFLWNIGSGLLHSGVVINGKEYAFGAHEKPGVSGVYWTRPRTEPPGGTFRCEILLGFTFRTQDEIDSIVKEASRKFLGPSWNLLANNCNHFCSYLCMELIGKPAPAWLNRAASIGTVLPCLVPREWQAPPTAEAADGELLDEAGQAIVEPVDEESSGEYTSDDEESMSMLRPKRNRSPYIARKDSSGRVLPPSVRAPPPQK